MGDGGMNHDAMIQGTGNRRQPRIARERSLTEILSLSDWWRFVPETLALLAVIWAAGLWLAGGVSAAGNMPHPFWIPVLLMSSQYGIMGGLFATLAATAAFFFTGLPPQSASQDFYAYAGVVAVQPCAWFATALALGGLRTLHMHHQNQLQEQLDQADVVAGELADGLERAIQEIERLEQRIATDYGTLTSFLHSLSKLELDSHRALVGSMVDVIRFAVGATNFAIYLKGPRGVEPCLGVEDGATVTAAAVPPVPASLQRDIDREFVPGTLPMTNRRFAQAPLWAPIRLPEADSPLGVVVCTRLLPSQDALVASRRLHDVCRVLAVLLSALREPAMKS